MGEEDDEIEQALRDLRTAGVEVVTFGQYLQPTKGHMKVSRYVEPAEFDRWKERATSEFGFAYCASGPMVRSSYRAGEFFIEAMLGKRPRAYSIEGQMPMSIDSSETNRQVKMTA